MKRPFNQEYEFEEIFSRSFINFTLTQIHKETDIETKNNQVKREFVFPSRK